jgi:hypothetical protein
MDLIIDKIVFLFAAGKQTEKKARADSAEEDVFKRDIVPVHLSRADAAARSASTAAR